MTPIFELGQHFVVSSICICGTFFLLSLHLRFPTFFRTLALPLLLTKNTSIPKLAKPSAEKHAKSPDPRTTAFPDIVAETSSPLPPIFFTRGKAQTTEESDAIYVEIASSSETCFGMTAMESSYTKACSSLSVHCIATMRRLFSSLPVKTLMYPYFVVGDDSGIPCR